MAIRWIADDNTISNCNPCLSSMILMLFTNDITPSTFVIGAVARTRFSFEQIEVSQFRWALIRKTLSFHTLRQNELCMTKVSSHTSQNKKF